MLDASAHQGLYAIVPTPALPGSARWDARATVNLDETARVVDQLVHDGVGGIIALGTTGECPTLSSREYGDFVRCVAQVVDHRVPLYIGATALGLHDVIDRLRVLRDADVDGTLLGLPMWQPLTEQMAVDYYAAVYDAFPDVNVMVYANERAFRFPFRTATDFWKALVDRAPTVTSAKFSRADTVATLRTATSGRINFLPSDMVAQEFAALDPGATTALWATAASMGPWPCKALIDAISQRDAAAVKRIAADIAWSNEPIETILADQSVFASYNIQVEKVRIDTAGYCKAGPVRPPYDAMPDEFVAASVQCGERWREMCDRYRSPILP